MKNCNCHSDINRDGSGQLQRYLKALDPSYAPVDGRKMEHLLQFAKKYAEQIRFYDIPESIIDDTTDKKKLSWKDFFARDMAIVIASVTSTDLSFYKKEFNAVRDSIETVATPAVFATLFHPVLAMLKKIDHWLTLAIPENPLYKDLVLAIDSDLRQQARMIMAYKKEFNVVDPNVQLEIDFSGIENEAVWDINEPLELETSLYQGNTREEKIRYATLYVEDIFYSFYKFLSTLWNESGKYLDFALQQYPGHQPHLALFITFLELFRIAQEQMNGLTERMLNFYYREVLHLAEKSSLPDKAHIVFELAKNTSVYDLPKGTALNAGKDKTGKEQIYITSKELVINQATVKNLSTVFIGKKLIEGENTKKQIVNIHARPFANSKDGFGEKFTVPDPKWPTFGKAVSIDSTSNTICDSLNSLSDPVAVDDRARIGIALSSPQLLLQGGKRLIQIGMKLKNVLTDEEIKQQNDLLEEFIKSISGIEIWLTGEKGWIRIGGDQDGLSQDQTDFIDEFLVANKGFVFPNDIDPGNFYFIDPSRRVNIFLPVAQQPVVPFDAKLHPGYHFDTAHPVMLLLNRPSHDLSIPENIYTELKGREFTIRTKVGSISPSDGTSSGYHFDGLKTLVLQNELGVQPLNKPVDPFTPYPLTGKTFYIGSNEVFNKPLEDDDEFSSKEPASRLAINLRKTIDEDDGIGEKADTETYRVSILNKRELVNLQPINGTSLSRSRLSEDILQITRRRGRKDEVKGSGKLNRLRVDRFPFSTDAEWTNKSEKGFIGLTLLLSRKEHTKLAFQDRQEIAPLLEIKEVSVSYDSRVRLESGIDKVFHVYPFGVTEIDIESPPGAIIKRQNDKQGSRLISEKKSGKNVMAVDAEDRMLPQFTYIDTFTTEETSDQKNSRKKGAEEILNQAIRKRSSQYSGLFQQEGMLLIGLQQLQPLQTISLLFQFAEGSAEDEDNKAPGIDWSYLVYNKWQPLGAENLVSDGTYGFQTTGIINISIPDDATTHHTIMEDGLIWLCASVKENASRIPMLIDVVTQAVEAEFNDQQNDPSHFDQPLAAGSISKLSVNVAQVSKVKQPFASFDGKHHEIGREFYTRVSERLRHKQRAITPWDYEHIVLDRFPSIYKVKCITHTDPDCICDPVKKMNDPEKILMLSYINDIDAGGIRFDNLSLARIDLAANDLMALPSLRATITGFAPLGNQAEVLAITNMVKEMIVQKGVDTSRMETTTSVSGVVNTIEIKLMGYPVTEIMSCCDAQIAPGHVLLVPISNLKNRNAVNPLQPKTGRRTLLAIEAWLRKYTSPFVKVHAKNPVYEQILVSFKVKFYTGTDKGFYLKKLNDAIVHFLTPWAFDENAEVKFGQKIYASSIINFIEERSYVDFITDFVMYICRKECCPALPVGGSDAEDVDDNWLDSINGCCDIERLMVDDDFEGDVIAAPSTARSILVSAAQHIISLYVEPPRLTPCEKLKLANSNKLSILQPVPETTEKKDAKMITAVPDETIKKEVVTKARKSENEIRDVKTAETPKKKSAGKKDKNK